MLRCCLGAYGCPNHAWMPSLGAGLIRLSQLAVTTAQSGVAVNSQGTDSNQSQPDDAPKTLAGGAMGWK